MNIFITPFQAESDEFLCHGWRNRRGHPIHILQSRGGSVSSMSLARSSLCWTLIRRSGSRRAQLSTNMLKADIIRCLKPTSERTLSWYFHSLYTCILKIANLCNRSLVNRSLLRKVRSFLGSSGLRFRLTEATADWMEIRTNNMIVITPKMNLLQIPIIDEFYVPPSDPAALSRATNFAAEKGLLSSRRTVEPNLVSSA